MHVDEKSQEERYVEISNLLDNAIPEDGSPILNRYSTFITPKHDFPGAKV